MLINRKTIFERIKVISSQYTAKSFWVSPYIWNKENTILQMCPSSRPVEKRQEKWCRVVVGHEDAFCLHLCHCAAVFYFHCRLFGGQWKSEAILFVPCLRIFLLVLLLCCCSDGCCSAVLPQHRKGVPSSAGPDRPAMWDAVHWVLTELLNDFVMAPTRIFAKSFLTVIDCHSEGFKCITTVSQL